MKLREMFDRILVESGHFLMQEDIELDLDKFAILVKSALGKFNQFSPHHERFLLKVAGGGLGGISYTFNSTFRGHGPPDWVSEIIPVRLAGIHPWYFKSSTQTQNEYLDKKEQFPWEYNKPVLYVPIGSVYDVTGVWNHKIVSVSYKDPTSGALRKELEVTTITENNDAFFKLLEGKFLVAIGRNRRAFTLNELPVSMDSDSLISEGQAKQELAEQQLADEQHKFWLSYR
jgi:hypothetical protein